MARKPKVLPPAPSTDGAIPPPAPLTDAERLSRLTDREKTLGMRSKVRKRVSLDLRLDEYESFLDLTERFGEEMQTVLRACVRFGLRHHQQWASNASGVSPFTEGDWTPRRASQLDPEGTRLAPPLDRAALPFQPHITAHSVPLRGTTVTIEDEAEMVFTAPPPRNRADAAFVPNGATIQTSRGDDEDLPASTPFDEWKAGEPLAAPYPVDGMTQQPFTVNEPVADETPAEAYL